MKIIYSFVPSLIIFIGFEANGIGFFDEQTGWIGGHEPNTYETTDGGDSWNLITIDDVYEDSINKFLRVGDAIYAVGNRIFKYAAHPIPATGPAWFDNSLCTLAAIPNPSTGTTTIAYTVPQDDNVQITIYIRGGLIYDRIIDEQQLAGTYSTEFTAHDSTPVLYASIVTGLYRQRVKFSNQP